MKTVKQEPQYLDKKDALVKAEYFCAYQERSQQEIRNKLYEWGIKTSDVEEIITELIVNHFLNEERFAMAYVSGKFNIKKWGKLKIKQGLKFKQIPDKLIQKALNSIDTNDYFKTLEDLAIKKNKMIVENDSFKRSFKLKNYLLSKGYENNLILEVLKYNDLK